MISKPRRASVRPHNTTNAFTSLRSQFANALEIVSRHAEAHPFFVFLLLLLVYIPAVLADSRSKPLWHDELFTFYLAQAPTLRSMWTNTRELDLNPPLVYVLTRLSYRLFGVSTLATRLPEILGFALAMVGMFTIVRRRMGVLFGALAVSLLLLSDVFPLASEARPYTLMLGFLALAIVGWQQAIGAGEKAAVGRDQEANKETAWPRRLGLLLLAGSLSAMLLSHVFSLLAYAALVAAEIARFWNARSWNPRFWNPRFRNNRSSQKSTVAKPILAALLVPGLAIASYLPMLRSHGGSIFPRAFQPTGTTIFTFYMGSIDRDLVVLWLTALAILFLLGLAPLRTHLQQAGFLEAEVLPASSQAASLWSFTPAEWIAIGGLLAGPLLLMTYLAASHGAWFARYGATESIGVTLLATALLGRWTSGAGRLEPRAALIGSVLALLISAQPVVAAREWTSGRVFTSFRNSEPHLKPCEACLRTAAAGADGHPVPLVAASGLTFLEMNHHEPAATADRIFFLTDAAAGKRFAHANIFAHMDLLVSRFHLPGHVVDYTTFIHTHPHFYVLGRYDYPEDWLLRKLIADGASLRVLGRTDDVYRDKELYEVTLPPPEKNEARTP